jgi:adenosylcobinamide-GDP ribazoletransferase
MSPPARLPAPLAARLTEAQLALMMLTRLPAGRLTVAPALGASVWAFPLVGGLVGAISAAVLLAAMWLGVAPALAAGLSLAAGVLVTGGLHEDGLADCADGFGGARARARARHLDKKSQPPCRT